MTATGSASTAFGSAPLRKLAVRLAAAAVAASMALAAPAPTAAAQDAGPFPDTPAGAFYTQAVEALHQKGVFAGTLCDPGFCPDEALDRAAMAVWTVRVLDEQDPAEVTSTRFADVDAAHPQAAFIERFAELGVTRGCGDGSRFCPQDNVIRAQMAVFLSRAFALAEGPDPGFDDVAADAWYAPSVASLAASGITRGCGDGSGFCPQDNVTRAQMALFLARALGLVDRPGETPDTPTSAPGGGAGGFTAISAGNKHACAVRADKSLACWGNNLDRQLNAAHGEFAAVSAGGYHTCALRVDNTVSCWGLNENGQTSRPRRVEFLALSSGFMHTCAVSADQDDAGSVRCWGLDIQGEATPVAGSYRKVSAGHEHTCGLRTDGAVQCWGGNSHGQAGVKNPAGSMTCTISGCRFDYNPIAGPFIDVSAGTTHTCAVRTGGSLECWGYSTDGQTTPPAGEFLAVSSGYKHSCAVAVDNTVRCWGRDAYGATAAPAGEFLAVSAGSSFSCGLRTNGSIECWGYSTDGQTTPPTK